MLRVVASNVSALTVTLIAVIPDEAIALRCFSESGPRGGQETFMDAGLASASITMLRSYNVPTSPCRALSTPTPDSGSTGTAATVAANCRRVIVNGRPLMGPPRRLYALESRIVTDKQMMGMTRRRGRGDLSFRLVASARIQRVGSH
jgi:hypothetical protein